MRSVVFGCLMLLASPALAKMTNFSSTDALKHVTASAQLAKVVNGLPAGHDLATVKIENTAGAFKLTFVYAPKKAPPAGVQADCIVVAKTAAQEIHPVAGITANALSEPVVDPAACQK